MIWTSTQGAYDTLATMHRMQEESIINTLEQFEQDISTLQASQANYANNSLIATFQQHLSMLQDTVSSMHLYIESLEARIESLESTTILEPLE